MLANLPGLGHRSARRIALHLLQKRDKAMLPLAEAIKLAAEKVETCNACGNLDLSNPCKICADPKRQSAHDDRWRFQAWFPYQASPERPRQRTPDRQGIGCAAPGDQSGTANGGISGQPRKGRLGPFGDSDIHREYG